MGSGALLLETYASEGMSHFKKEILETFGTREEALKREREIVNKAFVKRNDVYNIRQGGQDGRLSQETIKLISMKLKGKKAWNEGIPRTEEEMKKMSENRKGVQAWNKGIPRTEEEKKKVSETRLKMKIPSPFKGKKFTEEQLEKIRKGVANQPRSTCIHCGKTTTNANIKMYHNDNCKQK